MGCQAWMELRGLVAAVLVWEYDFHSRQSSGNMARNRMAGQGQCGKDWGRIMQRCATVLLLLDGML